MICEVKFAYHCIAHKGCIAVDYWQHCVNGESSYGEVALLMVLSLLPCQSPLALVPCCRASKFPDAPPNALSMYGLTQ